MIRRLLPLACAVMIAAATLARAQEPTHPYDLKNVLWKLSFSFDRGTISGDVTNSVVLTEQADYIEFDCSDLNIEKVTVNGKPAIYETPKGILRVALPTAGEKGARYAVRIVYRGAPQKGLYFVPGDRAFPSKSPILYTQGQGEDNHYWLPTYDKPDDKATSECYVTVPKGWTAVSNGALLGVRHGAAADTFHWKLSLPFSTYLISLVAGPLVEVKDHWHSVPVDFYVPPGLVNEGRVSFGATPKMIDLYSRLTGIPYPWPKFAQEAVGDFMYGGMENVTCVTQTIRTLHQASTEPVRDSTYLVAHELAHHWFGDFITCRSWEHSWLNEGFATTLPMFYDRATLGEDAFDLDRFKNFEGAIDTMGMRGRHAVAGDIGSTPNPNMGSVYDGGSSRIMMLEHLLGEDLFWKSIHTFLQTYAFQPVTTTDFFRVMSKASGRDLTPFMKQWFYSPATPSLSASVVGDDLVVDQLAPYYTLDLPVWILDGDTWQKRSLHLEGASSKLALGDLAGKPLLIDPEVWTAMELRYTMPISAADLIALYRHAPNAAQRARLIASMLARFSPEDRSEIARTEKVPGVLQILADHAGSDDRDLLLELSRNHDERVVNSAVLGLGRIGSTPVAEARLEQIAGRDPNEAVRESAIQVLLNWSNQDTLAQTAWHEPAFDDGYRVAAMGWFAAHEPARARRLALDFLSHSNSEPVRIAAIKALGIVKESAQGGPVYRALIRVARETSYAARIAAINSLAQLGDKDAIPVLQPLVENGPGGVAGAAQGAITQLGK